MNHRAPNQIGAGLFDPEAYDATHRLSRFRQLGTSGRAWPWVAAAGVLMALPLVVQGPPWALDRWALDRDDGVFALLVGVAFFIGARQGLFGLLRLFQFPIAVAFVVIATPPLETLVNDIPEFSSISSVPYLLEGLLFASVLGFIQRLDEREWQPAEGASRLVAGAICGLAALVGVTCLDGTTSYIEGARTLLRWGEAVVGGGGA